MEGTHTREHWTGDGMIRLTLDLGRPETSGGAPNVTVSLMDGAGLPRMLVEILRRKPALRLALENALAEEERRGRDQ